MRFPMPPSLIIMKNWSTDTKKLEKNQYKLVIWKLEQMINFGLDGQKINEKELKKYWNKLNIDPLRKRYLSFIMYGRDSLKKTN